MIFCKLLTDLFLGESVWVGNFWAHQLDHRKCLTLHHYPSDWLVHRNSHLIDLNNSFGTGNKKIINEPSIKKILKRALALMQILNPTTTRKHPPPKRLNSMFLQHVLCPEALKSKSFSTMAPMGDWLSKDFEEPSSTCGCSSLTAQTPKQVTLPKKKEKDHLPRLIFQKSIKLSDYNVTWVMFTKVSHPTTKSAWSHQSRTFQGCYPIVAPATSFFIHGIMKQYVAGQWNSLTHTH